jgi:hypothetical protein
MSAILTFNHAADSTIACHCALDLKTQFLMVLGYRETFHLIFTAKGAKEGGAA